MLGRDHYLYRLRAACIKQPHLNRHQLAALDRELAIVRASATPEAHLEASGHLIGIARAGAMDRAANAFETARRYDDPWAAAASAIEYSYAQRGANHAELFTNIQLGHQRAAPLRERSAEVHGAFAGLFLSLLHAQTSHVDLDQVHANIEGAFGILRRSDPAFDQPTWFDQPRYRRRMPWLVDAVQQWLAPYWSRIPSSASALPPGPDPVLPPPYASTSDDDWPADADPLDAPPDTSVADRYLSRQRDWPDPVLAAHWQTTRDALSEAGSPVAQEAISLDRQALFEIESTHNMLTLGALLAPMRAIAHDAWEKTPGSRTSVGRAWTAAAELTGMTREQILTHPRVRQMIERNIPPYLSRGCEGVGALNGEGGFDLLRHAVLWHLTSGPVRFPS